jgi:hypothetical protein
MGWRRRKRQAARDGDAGIQEGHGEGHQGRRHPQNRGRLMTPEDAVAAEQEAYGEASGVTQEDGCRVEVVAKEAEQRAGERRGGQGERQVVGEQSAEQDCDGGEQAGPGGQAVHAVDEIERVGTADEPEYCKRQAEPGRHDQACNGSDLHSGPEGGISGNGLSGELVPWLEGAKVVEQAEGKDEQGGGENSPGKGEASF